MKTITRFIQDDNGADLVEYALLVGVVALGAIVGLEGIRDAIKDMFTSLKNSLGAEFPAAGAGG